GCVKACPRRAAQLLGGRGALEGGLIRCPFHAWTYAADGRLRAIPLAEEAFAGEDRAGLSLAERPAAERCGVVLVRAEGSEPVDADAPLEGRAEDLPAP